MTQAIRFHAVGGPEVLQLEEIALGPPGRGEVLLHNAAIAVNFRDILVRRGAHRVPPLPSGLGLESAGTVAAVGADVSELAVGDRVACVAGPDGAYATHRIVPAARAVRLPPAIAPRTAAAMMIRGMTARYLLHETYVVKAGDTILVHAAAGGVGLIMCQWAKHLGATVIGTVGTEQKAEIARAHGCDATIVYSTEDFVSAVRRLTQGNGVAAVFDSVGKDTFEKSLRCLAPRGLLVSFGTASGPIAPFDIFELNRLDSLYVTSPAFVTHTRDRSELLLRADALFGAIAAGVVNIKVGRTYPLADTAQAHEDLQARRTTGISILVP